jgi:DNA-directed RNA polymerase subunit M/transcription elongation factor TFIIS
MHPHHQPCHIHSCAAKHAAPTCLQVDQPCPKCDHPEMEFYTMQLRSADEGQTVFYECPKCGHKYNQNT